MYKINLDVLNTDIFDNIVSKARSYKVLFSGMNVLKSDVKFEDFSVSKNKIRLNFNGIINSEYGYMEEFNMFDKKLKLNRYRYNYLDEEEFLEDEVENTIREIYLWLIDRVIFYIIIASENCVYDGDNIWQNLEFLYANNPVERKIEIDEKIYDVRNEVKLMNKEIKLSIDGMNQVLGIIRKEVYKK